MWRSSIYAEVFLQPDHFLLLLQHIGIFNYTLNKDPIHVLLQFIVVQWILESLMNRPSIVASAPPTAPAMLALAKLWTKWPRKNPGGIPDWRRSAWAVFVREHWKWYLGSSRGRSGRLGHLLDILQCTSRYQGITSGSGRARFVFSEA